MTRTLEQGITLIDQRMFDFNDPAAGGPWGIEAVAAPLANICRFAGQVRPGNWYSVAQHAVNASRIVPSPHAFDALMHDTAEAFTNDIVKPLKTAVPLFADLEQRIESAMAAEFGFTYPLAPEVKLADNQMLALEMRYVCGWDPDEYDFLRGTGWEDLVPLVELESWSPTYAYQRFLRRYHELRPKGVDVAIPVTY